MSDTYIYHQLPPTCCGACYTIFWETNALLGQKTVYFLQCCYIGCAVKCKIYLVFEMYSAVTVFNTMCISSFCILITLKILVKIPNCSTLTF